MEDIEGQGSDATGPEQSPSEKLERDGSVYPSVPGSQNPDSKEIKQEINPNTE
ncbi:MAG TPA: hypothetical protein VGN86_09145 [Pyrinomonadaceae bacterium]|jgi:hypothetical protein|nr:hypothetical protein [Pyrinomonadaceae bacterium]